MSHFSGSLGFVHFAVCLCCIIATTLQHHRCECVYVGICRVFIFRIYYSQLEWLTSLIRPVHTTIRRKSIRIVALVICVRNAAKSHYCQEKRNLLPCIARGLACHTLCTTNKQSYASSQSDQPLSCTQINIRHSTVLLSICSSPLLKPPHRYYITYLQTHTYRDEQRRRLKPLHSIWLKISSKSVPPHGYVSAMLRISVRCFAQFICSALRFKCVDSFSPNQIQLLQFAEWKMNPRARSNSLGQMAYTRTHISD